MMLDRSKLSHRLDAVMDTIFVDLSDQYELAQQVWRQIANDHAFRMRACHEQLAWSVPTWDEPLDKVITIDPIGQRYAVFGVDGSQIYPDRHQGVSCFLVNVGMVLLCYGSAGLLPSPTNFTSEPYVISGNDLELHVSVDLVNAMRQEFELQAGLLCHQKIGVDLPSLVLLDGSLIFWHLDAKDNDLRATFLPKYIALLERYQQEKIVMASYISSPKSRELSNLIRLKLADFQIDAVERYQMVDQVIDAALFAGILKPGERSILFNNRAKISEGHPPGVRTCFFYLHSGTEIGRVEIPAWVAQEPGMVDWVAAAIFDQCAKGHGYPIALAESHEQAVVKGPDREFFYHLLQKKAMTMARHCKLSTKALCKRGVTF